MKILSGLVSVVFFYLIFTIVVRIRSRPKRKIKEIFHGHVYWDTDNVSKINLRSNRTQKLSNIIPLVSIPKVPEIKPVVPVSIPKVPEIKPVVPVSIPKTLNIKNPSWRNCQRITCSKSKECDKPYKNRKSMNCCSDSLFLMLKDIISILEENNIDTTIIYGTLIGSLRSKDIISFTPDVDIALPGDIYNKMHIWSKYLNDAGYIVFKSNIYRVCKANKVPEPHNKAPWTREWYPYMDIYNLKQSGNKIWSTHLTYIRWPKSYVWPTKKCIIRDVKFPCPQQPELVLNSLKKWYGDWRVVQKRGTLIKKVPLGYPPRLDIVGKQFIIKDGEYKLMKPDSLFESTCKDKRVEKVIDIIRSAAVYNISIFPRNGFLLGIVRHGGFLPTEKVDMDLGMLYSDISRIRSHLQIPSLKYPDKMIRFEVKNMYPGYEKSIWDGIHPKTNKYLPSHCSIFIGNKKLTTGSFFYSYNASSVFYPMYVIKNHNLKMFKMEQMEYRKHNDGLIDLKTGKRGQYGNAKLGKLFDVSAFKKTVQVPFYDTFIDIPIGYKSILKSFYGDDWHIIKKRRKFDNTLEIISGIIDPKNIC